MRLIVYIACSPYGQEVLWDLSPPTMIIHLRGAKSSNPAHTPACASSQSLENSEGEASSFGYAGDISPNTPHEVISKDVRST